MWFLHIVVSTKGTIYALRQSRSESMPRKSASHVGLSADTGLLEQMAIHHTPLPVADRGVKKSPRRRVVSGTDPAPSLEGAGRYRRRWSTDGVCIRASAIEVKAVYFVHGAGLHVHRRCARAPRWRDIMRPHSTPESELRAAVRADAPPRRASPAAQRPRRLPVVLSCASPNGCRLPPFQPPEARW